MIVTVFNYIISTEMFISIGRPMIRGYDYKGRNGRNWKIVIVTFWKDYPRSFLAIAKKDNQ
jgi:hypothetical protein